MIISRAVSIINLTPLLYIIWCRGKIAVEMLLIEARSRMFDTFRLIDEKCATQFSPKLQILSGERSRVFAVQCVTLPGKIIASHVHPLEIAVFLTYVSTRETTTRKTGRQPWSPPERAVSKAWDRRNFAWIFMCSSRSMLSEPRFQRV